MFFSPNTLLQPDFLPRDLVKRRLVFEKVCSGLLLGASIGPADRDNSTYHPACCVELVPFGRRLGGEGSVPSYSHTTRILIVPWTRLQESFHHAGVRPEVVTSFSCVTFSFLLSPIVHSPSFSHPLFVLLSTSPGTGTSMSCPLCFSMFACTRPASEPLLLPS